MLSPEMEALRKVDALDTKALKLKREIQDLPDELAKSKARVAEAQARIQALAAELKKCNEEIRKLDLDVKSNLEQVKKFQAQQNMAKTNEEYAALKKQIGALQTANGALEDKALAHYERVDAIKPEEKAAKAALVEAEGKLKAEQAEVEKEIAGLEQQLGTVVVERAAAEKIVPTGAMQQYARVLQKLGGRALAEVKGKICQGCYIEISPQTLSLLLGGKEIVSCKQCARLLYLERDYRALSPVSFTVGEKDRDATSKDGNW